MKLFFQGKKGLWGERMERRLFSADVKLFYKEDMKFTFLMWNFSV